ncbi:amidohydrolase [Dinghuibacter silviterrae]|uniref:Omega-amidase YafV n=1 Tax=Dinghuibacter silviterrae TaxID=1539049 RepID=A0A4R8DNI8_9BACT|nr:amidohydrolase [Dinghuibacter silviterrae]TDW99573.1 putative amidohydrolase [Dinghuibacter silviterrae]
MSTLTFTLVQANLRWEDKAANLKHLGDLIAGLREKTEVVLLPEMFTTGFSMDPERLGESMDGPTVDWIRQTAAARKIVLAGSFIATDNGEHYNRLVWMLPNGQYGCYDKRHLFAYADEDQHYAPGAKRLIASVKGWKINLQVCYDLRFPVWARNRIDTNGQPEYDVLVYVANWPERRNLAWKTLLRARAIENQCFVIGVNRVGRDGKDIAYSGDSMVIDPQGDILYHREGIEDTYTITLDKTRLEETRGRFPFLRDADEFTIAP